MVDIQLYNKHVLSGRTYQVSPLRKGVFMSSDISFLCLSIFAGKGSVKAPSVSLLAPAIFIWPRVLGPFNQRIPAFFGKCGVTIIEVTNTKGSATLVIVHISTNLYIIFIFHYLLTYWFCKPSYTVSTWIVRNKLEPLNLWTSEPLKTLGTRLRCKGPFSRHSPAA